MGRNGSRRDVLLGTGATLVALAGYATFDSASGMFDLHPVNVYAVLPFVGTVGASGMAWIAVLFGWGKR